MTSFENTSGFSALDYIYVTLSQIFEHERNTLYELSNPGSTYLKFF